jgi:hypothetical protein
MTYPRQPDPALQPTPSSKLVYARARPETVELTEQYFFEQEVSRNGFLRPTQEPLGNIEISVPYDGGDYFSRQAVADIAAQQEGAAPGNQALIGHLLLANHESTNLRDRLRLNERFGSYPITVPLPTASEGGLRRLSADDCACVISVDYQPTLGKIRQFPLNLELRLVDPDSTDSLSNDIERYILAGDVDALYQSEVAAQIRQQASFRPHLMLALTAQLNLPKAMCPQGDHTPVVRTVSLDWPTVTSLQSLVLFVDTETWTVSYNPSARSLEWGDIALHRIDDDNGNPDVVTYLSPSMLLLIRQPGELYEQPSLDGWVEVDLPDVLLSGLDARLFDALGDRSTLQPARSTSIRTRLHLVLDDAFAKRPLSPFHHLHFDEVIPEERRFADVIAALTNRGFDVNAPRSANGSERFLYATRAEGRDVMKLLLYIEGKQNKGQRIAHAADGQDFQITFDSGDLNIYIRGELPRDSRALTREMNDLQRSLREKFDHLRAWRR